MDLDLNQLLGSPEQVSRFFSGVQFHDAARAQINLHGIATRRIPGDLLDHLFRELGHHLPSLSDPDMALNNLERFIAAARSPLSLAALFARDPTAIPVLLKIFSTSQYLADQMIRDPASYDSLRLAAGQPVAREILIDELDLALSVLDADDDASAMTIIRRFKHRETLRIAYGDIVGGQTLETVTGQISYLADAICTATLRFAHRKPAEKHGTPQTRSGEPSTLTVIAMGKLGGNELNYSSDIDLVFFYLADGQTDGRRTIQNRDYFDRVGRRFVRLLTETTPLGNVYRVDMRLRPHGAKAPLSISVDNAISYYDLQGRTWERQALVKARPVAGDMELGERLLHRLASWIFARRLSVVEINGIKALKRQIERRTREEGTESSNIKTGHGGIRDIEFVIQFLQLLHGDESFSIRNGNTLDALGRLYHAGCITSREQSMLESGYRWLRQLEHRLQIMFDLQTHSLPESPQELYRVARRMEINGDSVDETLRLFREKLEHITQQHRTILDHLLHDAFSESESSDAEQEADLVLDPFLTESRVEEILLAYGFENPLAAHRNLSMLATERNRFLKPRRCLHFLAAIARQLLAEIAKTPDPDRTLLNLTKVSDSLGGKAAIWELFSVHPPSLKMYVRLCASCEYLCRILTRNPGMIDELTDALVIHHLPALETLQGMLQELLSGAEDIEPIIHSFKDAHHLRVGIRDIIGQDEIARTHLALSDIGEVCLGEIVKIERTKLASRYGQPIDSQGQPVHLQVLAMGKLGGREPNYHSDLDLVFLYDSDSNEFHQATSKLTSHQDYFSRLAANITKRISGSGPYGRLYEVDCRLRPTGKSGSLAVSLREFRRYFHEGHGQLWERLAMCKARPLFQTGHPEMDGPALVHEMVTAIPWQPSFAQEVAEMRLRMQEGASSRNIKRGPGGTVDVEFAIQMLQLKYATDYPDVLVPNTVLATEALRRLALISEDDFRFFCQSYGMLRWVEARLRLMDTEKRHDLPDIDSEFANLAFLLGYSDHQQLRSEIDYLRRENRRRFTLLTEVHGPGTP